MWSVIKFLGTVLSAYCDDRCVGLENPFPLFGCSLGNMDHLITLAYRAKKEKEIGQKSVWIRKILDTNSRTQKGTQRSGKILERKKHIETKANSLKSPILGKKGLFHGSCAVWTMQSIKPSFQEIRQTISSGCNILSGSKWIWIKQS